MSELTEVELMQTTDASVWAREFVRLHGGDEDLMLSWFAAMWGATNDPLQRRIEELEERTTWQSVNWDGLPPLGTTVLLFSNGVVQRDTFIMGYCARWEREDCDPVLVKSSDYWMLLPNPPEVTGND